MGRRPGWWHTLQASKSEALLAVDLYNRVGENQSVPGFAVHMAIAWTQLLHAAFLKRNIDFHIYDKARPVLTRGRHRTWPLSTCIETYITDPNDACRRNVEFFIAIRDDIEHRYASLIATVISGKVQAYIKNYEDVLVAEFGEQEGIARQLRFPLFSPHSLPRLLAR